MDDVPMITMRLQEWLDRDTELRSLKGKLARHEGDLITAAARARGKALEEAIRACTLADPHHRYPAEALEACVEAIEALKDKVCRGEGE